ncbi:uncharacterized protein Tco025E_00734 [Trypanosoma conorhini]|uniref:Uncharacterized protein n=1 Tax=Trypanosoma conorhini TaxID=83891 RepID=A0A422QAW0_9TRYP|nr:uncharacterized protein Tco025E_00734 [Trypanosoma conorhini]RNF27076.1 hypothetical protein Tco025E_00734 [Trypanosoma conorhini]
MVTSNRSSGSSSGGGGEKRQGGNLSLRASTGSAMPGISADSRSAADAEGVRLPREDDAAPASQSDGARAGEWAQPHVRCASVRSLSQRTAAGGASLLDSEALLRRKWSTIQRECPLNPLSSTTSVGSASWYHAREASMSSLTQFGTPPALRAGAAVFFFTLNEEESMRQSPPLEVVGFPGEREGGAGDGAVPRNSVAAASIKEDLTDPQEVAGIGAVTTQKAESVDLQRSSCSLSVPRYSTFLRDVGELAASTRESHGPSTSDSPGQPSSGRRPPCGGGDIMPSAHDAERLATSLGNNINEDADSADHLFRYEVIRFSKRPGNDDGCRGGLSSSDDDCCCCCGVDSLFWCGGGDRESQTALLVEDRPGRHREETSAGQHPGPQCRLCRRLFRLWDFVNAVAGDLPLASEILCLMNYIAGILVTLAVVLLLAGLWSERPTPLVDDGSTCHGTAVPGFLTPDTSFSICLFLFNASLASCFAIRAVRYENTGLLICHFVTVLLQLCRVIYFLCSTSSNDLPNEVLLYTKGLLSFSVILLFSSCATYRWVYKSFGWGRFMRGITRSVLLRRHRRQMFVRSVVQLDVYSTISGALTVAYTVDSNVEQLLGLALALLSCVAAMLYPTMLRRRSMWFLCFFSLTLAFSLVFYCHAIGSAVEPYLVRGAGTQFEASHCYRPQLLNCLRDLELEVISHGGVSGGGGACLPSAGHRSEFVQFAHRKENCLPTWNDHYVKGFTHCCEVYGHCRLKDAVRSYSVVNLMVLAAIVWSLRVLLVWLWVRSLSEDAEEAAMRLRNPTSDSPAPPEPLPASPRIKCSPSA